MLLGALAAIELALADAGIPHMRGGVEAAMDSLRAWRPASPANSLNLLGVRRITTATISPGPTRSARKPRSRRRTDAREERKDDGERRHTARHAARQPCPL
jgi:hypothetical protein